MASCKKCEVGVSSGVVLCGECYEILLQANDDVCKYYDIDAESCTKFESPIFGELVDCESACIVCKFWE